ncbi:hypothetical protein GZ77_26105 [Endozoicomonas montiporae]|uniref:Capsid protein n=2 Tax=cellular organisms TaxID=131567 RepID=A0A081MYL6_9GAMM|nr:hypothetical protein [Endozoicomonas montiporae]KEQ11289.1 hypothetical protein GZ77_26105 [Endozoicomonas montiporae]
MSAKRPFPVNPVLVAIAVAYRNTRMIADAVLPKIPVGLESFKWYEYDKAERFALPNTEVSRKGVTSEVEFSADERTDSTKDYGLEDAIPQTDIDNAREGYDPLSHAAQALTDLIHLGREVRVAKVAFDTASHGTVEAVENAMKFDNKDADLLSYFLEMLDKPLMRPNTLNIGRREWTQLRTNRSIVAAMHGNSGEKGSATARQVAELLELETVNIGEAHVNIAKKGKQPTIERAWKDHCCFTYINPAATTENGAITWGFTGQFDDWFAADWHDNDIGLKGGRRVRVGEQVKELVVAKDCGLLLKDVLGYTLS